MPDPQKKSISPLWTWGGFLHCRRIPMPELLGLTRLYRLQTAPALFAFVVALGLSATGCGGSDSPTSPTPTPPSAPFAATDLREGTGATATLGRTISVSYTGWVYDPTRPESKGAQFDSNPGYTFQFTATSVIQGWVQGVVGMKVGGQRRLVIPPNLGYGSQMVGTIPPNSTLVFDVMLLSVN
jgi:FKBP-type peptidyl-prolyl cis-trans isomerase FkpA